MNLSDWLTQSTAQLSGHDVSTARLDALILLEDLLGKNRSWILAHPEQRLDKPQISHLAEQLKRRCAHEPLAYIRGKSEFFGRELLVNTHTLEPRPETETMIELLLQLVERRKLKATSRKKPVEKSTTKNQQPKIKERLPHLDGAQGANEQQTDTMLTIVDVGTGSGCIAITAQLELPNATVLATDIDQTCLRTAKTNAHTHSADVSFHQGNLLQPVKNIIDQLSAHSTVFILANLPYVPETYLINQAAMHEPEHAIYGGKDGLDYYRQLFVHIAELSRQPFFVLTESLPFQHKELASIAEAHHYTEQDEQDFIQLFEKNAKS